MAHIKVCSVVDKDGTEYLVRASRLSEFLNAVRPSVARCSSYRTSISKPNLGFWIWSAYVNDVLKYNVYEKKGNYVYR